MLMADREIEYESDPEEAMLSLKLRRRKASDDEEEEMEDGGRAGKLTRKGDDDSDGESEGAVAEYEDELEEEEYDEEEVEEDVEIDGALERVETGRDGNLAVEKGVDNYTAEVDDEEVDGAEGQNEEEKKSVEPFTVPTAGAFYMHDDRFGERAKGQNRRTLGRTLWESKDDRKWGHDKFEELTTKDKSFGEPRRSSRGRNRGRGRNKATDRVNSPGNRLTENIHNNTQNDNNQVNVPKSAKGRGPRRYQQSSKNSYGGPASQNKQSGKSLEKQSYVSSGRSFEPVSNVSMPRKQVASALNISSPPFYPTGSSTIDNTLPLKRDIQAGKINRRSQQSVVDQSVVEENLKKNIVDSIGVGNLYIDDTPSVKPSNSMQVPLSQLQGQGRGLTSSTQMAYQPVVSKNQFNRGPPSQMHNIQRNIGQSQFQASKSAGAANAFESGEMESASEQKAAVVAKGKGKGTLQASGKGPFLYGGTQLMGSGHNDQNFPAFLPVMPFGGQHPRGMGVPAVAMAYPGYVAQSQLGLGSSEMTWLPVLAGAAGALGASYCPQYISMDGSYNARSSGHMSSISDASSRENNAAKAGNDVKPAQSLELANNFGQRQKNSRRYRKKTPDIAAGFKEERTAA